MYKTLFRERYKFQGVQTIVNIKGIAISTKILTIIPARGGSKGVPGKNIRLLNGKHLICHTIEEALKSKYLNQIFVSTDDAVIARISEKCGADVIHRPAELARDESSIIDVMFHAIDAVKNKFIPDIVIRLQPTSPLRNVNDIDAAIELYFNSKSDSVISMCKVDHSPYWCFRFDNDDFDFKPLFGDKYLRMRRQELPEIYRPNGAIYITSLKNLYENREFYCSNLLPYIMPVERSIDIDEEIDFMLAEQFLRSGG